MSKFIKLTEIKSRHQETVFGTRYMDIKTPRLVNIDHIVSVEDNAIHFADFKISVAESLKQIQKLIETNNNE